MTTEEQLEAVSKLHSLAREILDNFEPTVAYDPLYVRSIAYRILEALKFTSVHPQEGAPQ